MIGLAVAAGISALSSIVGTAVANKKKKKAEAARNAAYDKQIDWYNDELSQNFLDRADSRAALKKIYDANQDSLKTLNTNAVKSGMTDEAKVAAASNANKNLATAVSDINAQGASYKDSLNRQKNSVEMAKSTGNYNSAIESANNTGQAISNIGSAAGNLASIYAMGGATGGTKGASITSPSATQYNSLSTPISQWKPISGNSLSSLAKINI